MPSAPGPSGVTPSPRSSSGTSRSTASGVATSSGTAPRTGSRGSRKRDEGSASKAEAELDRARWTASSISVESAKSGPHCRLRVVVWAGPRGRRVQLGQHAPALSLQLTLARSRARLAILPKVTIHPHLESLSIIACDANRSCPAAKCCTGGPESTGVRSSEKNSAGIALTYRLPVKCPLCAEEQKKRAQKYFDGPRRLRPNRLICHLGWVIRRMTPDCHT
jgi:hypothetical protein